MAWLVCRAKDAPASLTDSSFLWETVKCAQYCTTVVNWFVYLEKYTEMSELSDFKFKNHSGLCTVGDDWKTSVGVSFAVLKKCICLAYQKMSGGSPLFMGSCGGLTLASSQMPTLPLARSSFLCDGEKKEGR